MIAKTVAATSLMMIDLPSNSPRFIIWWHAPSGKHCHKCSLNEWLSCDAVRMQLNEDCRTGRDDSKSIFSDYSLGFPFNALLYCVIIFKPSSTEISTPSLSYLSLFGLAWPHWYDNTTYYSTYNVMPTNAKDPRNSPRTTHFPGN